MSRSNRILFVVESSDNPRGIFLNSPHRLSKGFVKLGCDVEIFGYGSALRRISPFRSKTLSGRLYKRRVDELLADYARNYRPDIIYVAFPRMFDGASVAALRDAAADAVFVGGDGDPWPQRRKRRIEAARLLNIVTATNDGEFLETYRKAGARLCAFIPNFCDPDVHRRYEVGPQWESDILWTGKAHHGGGRNDSLREQIVSELSGRIDCAVYGCFGRDGIDGIDYLYAISGARIGVNINAVNSVRLYHSDRLTHYVACGTFTLAKRVPDTDLLFEDGVHLRYFDTAEEFFELADWYLKHDEERERIAAAGMKRAHEQFNCTRIAGYVLDLAEKGSYSALWNQ